MMWKTGWILGLKSLSRPLIREIVNITLLEKGMIQYRNVSTPVSVHPVDAHRIDVGRGLKRTIMQTSRKY